MNRLCCELSCSKPAEFEILDVLDHDPAGACTDACEAHVGLLLGHRIGLHIAGRMEEWRIYPIGAEQDEKAKP